jgi:hypothetical protein
MLIVPLQSGYVIHDQNGPVFPGLRRICPWHTGQGGLGSSLKLIFVDEYFVTI